MTGLPAHPHFSAAPVFAVQGKVRGGEGNASPRTTEIAGSRSGDPAGNARRARGATRAHLGRFLPDCAGPVRGAGALFGAGAI